MYHYSCPMSSRNRPTRIRRYGLGADCIIIFDVRTSSATKVYYELLWYLNTYDFARGLALSSHSSSPSAAVVEQSGRRVLPFLDPSASPVGATFLFLSPRLEGESLHLPPPRFHGRSVSRSYWAMSPIPPGTGNSFGFPWPSSWSSPAPYKEPVSASPSGERPWCLRAGGQDSQSALMPPPSPVKGMGAQTPHMVKLWEINILPDVQNLPDSQGASRLAHGPR